MNKNKNQKNNNKNNNKINNLNNNNNNNKTRVDRFYISLLEIILSSLEISKFNSNKYKMKSNNLSNNNNNNNNSFCSPILNLPIYKELFNKVIGINLKYRIST